MPMRRLLLALMALLTLTLPVQAANTYHVTTSGTGGACTSLNPCGSIATAVGLMAGGDTLLIHAGNYSQGISWLSMTVPSGTSWSNPTTIKSAGDGVVQLNAIDISAYGATSYHFILISGFKLVGVGAFLGGQNMADIRLENCDISGAEQDGIQSWEAQRIQLVGNTIHDSGTGRLNHGIYAQFPDGLIEGNTFYNITGYGIQFYHSGGCTQPPALAPNKCGSNTIIRNNIVHDTHGDGGVTMGQGDNIKFYNNIIYNNSNVGVQVRYGDSNNIQIYNNTIVGNTGVALLLTTVDSVALTNTLVTNNILYDNSGSISVGGATGTVFTTNLCNFVNLACSLAGNPAFVNAGAGNFALGATSAARNAGTTLSAPYNVDILGTTRPQGPPGTNWDIGAYEFVEGGGLPPSGNPIYLSAGGHTDVPTDSGDCTVPENILTPRATLVEALRCMTVPGKKLYIRGGTYSAVLDTGGGIPVTGGSDAAHPTLIEGYAAETVVLTLPVGQQVGVFLRNISYVKLDKLTVNALGRVDSNALACINAQHLTITRSTFYNSYYEPGYFADCSDVSVTQTIFHTAQVAPIVTLDGTMPNVTFDEVEFHTGPYQGLNANVNSGSNTSLVVTRTQIHGVGMTGGSVVALDLGPGTGSLIVNNIVDHNNAGIRIRSGAGTVKVYQNAIASNAGQALQCDAGATAVTISNNIAFGNGANAVLNNCSATLAKNLDTGADPLWANVAGRDFHPGPTSPAIDNGATLLEVAVAIDGTPRPVGLLYDQGPYEQTLAGGPPGDPAPPRLITRWLGMLY
jgi:hypothetical protein